MIARTVADRDGGARSALLLVNDARHDDISVYDALPHFKDGVMIVEFKSELVAGVASFAKSMERTGLDIAQRQSTMQELHVELQHHSDEPITMPSSKKCAVCQQAAVSRAFTYFPRCGHAFHTTCVTKSRRRVPRQSAPSARRLPFGRSSRRDCPR